MVLEEASSGQELTAGDSSFSSDPYQPISDTDRYSGDRNPSVLSSPDSSYIAAVPGVYVNLNSLPKRWGLFGPRPHPKPLVNAIQDSCRLASDMLGRPVRQEEADALAYHFARGIRIGSYGAPVGTSIAMVLAYRGVKTFRFPGWTPPSPGKEGSRFNPDKFLHLRGQSARMAWQVLRFNAYGFLGLVIGQVVFGSYALTAGSAGRLMDPRLKELAEHIRERARKGQTVDGLPGRREVDTTPGAREGETLDMARQRTRAQEGLKARKREPERDDMSPTSGSFSDEFLETGNESDVGAMRGSQEDIGFYGQPMSTQKQHSRQQRDDASPAAQAASAPKPSGSAWERLRQQAVSGTQTQTSQRTSRAATSRVDESSNADSFSFSQGDEDRQLARSEAQKEFDARVEREREGKNFDDRSAKRGWGS